MNDSCGEVTALIPRLKFVDELPPIILPGRPSTIDPYVEALKERPGQWALVHRRPKTTKNAFGGRASNLKKRGAQVAQRTVGDEVHLYARWPRPEDLASSVPRFVVGEV